MSIDKNSVGFLPKMSLTRSIIIYLFIFFFFNAHYTTQHTHICRASERNFSGGYKVRYRAPKSYWGPSSLIRAHAVKSFLSFGCRSSFKREGITIFAYQLGPMKNTTRHKFGSNPARGSRGAL